MHQETSGSQSVIPRLTVPVSPTNLLTVQTLLPRPTELQKGTGHVLEGLQGETE